MDSFGQMSAAIGLQFLGTRMVEMEECVSHIPRVYIGDKQTVKKNREEEVHKHKPHKLAK